MGMIFMIFFVFLYLHVKKKKIYRSLKMGISVMSLYKKMAKVPMKSNFLTFSGVMGISCVLVLLKTNGGLV